LKKALVFYARASYRLCIYACHGPAFFRARPARFCATFAMIHLMFFAFFRTGITNFCARITERSGMLAAYTHQPCRGVTRLGTFSINFDTACHLGNIFFVQAFSSTVVAFSCTL
jgi:hypothetical protein